MGKYLDLAPACDLAFLSGDGNGKSWKFHGESIELFMTSYSSPAGITVDGPAKSCTMDGWKPFPKSWDKRIKHLSTGDFAGPISPQYG